MRIFTGSVGPGRIAACIALALTASINAVAETELTINGVDIDSSVIDLYLESRTQRPATQASPDERAGIITELTDLYLLATQPRAVELAKEADVKAQLDLQMYGLLAQVMATDYIERNQATDEEILAEYATQIELAPPQQFKARHILVETQSAAQGLIARLSDGADFEELAKAESTGPSGPNGGDLGWFSPNQMVTEFSDAVAALEDGEYTKEPVQTQFGWHVILREESRASEPPTLESVRDVIKQQVEQRKLQAYLTQLRELNAN